MRGLRLTWAYVAVLAGCGSGSHELLDVGGDDSGGLALPGLGDAGAPTLDAHFEEKHVTVQFVTLTCSGPCADVQVVASGGNAPYSYAWEDGTTSATRHVCPTADTTYSVTVTDTASVGEVAHSAHSTTLSLPAYLTLCPDGGAPPREGGTVSGDSGSPPVDGGTTGCGAPNTVCWASWVGYSVGTPGSGNATITTPAGDIAVTYAGEVAIQTTVGATIDWFTPVSTYTSATVTDPPALPGSIFQLGGTTLVDTLTFSRPVTDPVLAISSLGNAVSNQNSTYTFGTYGETFTILQQGPGSMAGTGMLMDVNGSLVGSEGNGLVQLMGTFTQIQWTDPTAESGGGHAFTVGVPPQ